MKKNIKKKINIVNEISILAEEAVMTILIDYSNIKSLDIKYIRRALFEKNIKLKVFKNTLAKTAFQTTIHKHLCEFLSGQTLMIFSKNDITKPIKIIDRLKTKYNEIKIKSLSIYGKLFFEKNIKELKKLPTKEIALTQFSLYIKTPILNITNCLNSPHSKLYFLLKTLSEKQN